jgi:hypothetical protein
MKTYDAPWSISLVAISVTATLLCVGIALVLIWSGRTFLVWTAVVPLAPIGCMALFAIRGYTVTPDAILVHRVFWATPLPLGNLESAEFQPDAMSGSIRTFGNGGLFSFTGFYQNETLGSYQAFVTDPNRTVVLHFSTRTVVVSPSAPEDFVHELDAASHR